MSGGQLVEIVLNLSDPIAEKFGEGNQNLKSTWDELMEVTVLP